MVAILGASHPCRHQRSQRHGRDAALGLFGVPAHVVTHDLAQRRGDTEAVATWWRNAYESYLGTTAFVRSRLRSTRPRLECPRLIGPVRLDRLVLRGYPECMKTVTSTEAKAKLNALLAEVERTGASVTITNHGRPVAVLMPSEPRSRRFGQLPALTVPDDFDEQLPDTELAAWEGNS